MVIMKILTRFHVRWACIFQPFLSCWQYLYLSSFIQIPTYWICPYNQMWTVVLQLIRREVEMMSIMDMEYCRSNIALTHLINCHHWVYIYYIVLAILIHNMMVEDGVNKEEHDNESCTIQSHLLNKTLVIWMIGQMMAIMHLECTKFLSITVQV